MINTHIVSTNMYKRKLYFSCLSVIFNIIQKLKVLPKLQKADW